MERIAVLLASFNRKQTTIRCLSKLFDLNKNLDVYLVDDKSTDGTSAAIAEQFPQVRLVEGNGNLFWNRGMHLAWKTAAETADYDYYLWLNDDVVLYAGWLTEMLECANLAGNKAVIAGIIKDHNSDTIIYGGTDENRRLRIPNGTLQTITNLNGNVVLVPRYVYKELGNLDPVYHHDLGDVDYSLRAKKKNIPVFTTRIAIGSGDKNGFCRVRQWNGSLKSRFKKLYSPLGSPPPINFYFRKRHYGILNATQYFAFIHLINILPDKVIKRLFGDKYI